MGLLTQTGDDSSLERVLTLLERVLPANEYSMLVSSLSQLGRRMLEVTLLSDEVLRPIAVYRDVYVGKAEQMIRGRIDDLGLSAELDRADVEHLRYLLLEGAQPSSRVAPVTDASEYALFRGRHNHGAAALRCDLCGYHFRREDLSSQRGRLADEFGLKVALRKQAERLEDKLKNPEETACEIDHITPRAGWGPTRTDNLQFLCQYCNRGKAIFRWWGELLPGAIIGSLPSIMGNALSWQLRASFVSTLMRDDSKCRLCGLDQAQVELTVRPIGQWVSPLRLQTVCYGCSTYELLRE